MSNIELSGDRVALNTSILARADSSFYDFNGSVNYPTIKELLVAHPELTTGGSYKPPKDDCDLGVGHNYKKVSETSQQLKNSFKLKALSDYLPFGKLDLIQSNVGTTRDGNLAVMMWRPTSGGAKVGEHYGLCQYRGNPKAKWMSIKGSDSKCCESQVFSTDYVYTTFGMGDFLLLKSMNLNYLCFAGDGAVKNSPHIQFIQNKVGTRTIRVIADNDKSGRETASHLRSYGFTVEVFNWKKLGGLAKPKMDLRDLGWIIKSEGGELNDLKKLITQGAIYEQ